MHDPGESGASHVLLPLPSLPKSATGTSRAFVGLAVGGAQAIHQNDEVFDNECQTPLIPANK
eukprot:12923520-Prorocentrum_lima.AAC.1